MSKLNTLDKENRYAMFMGICPECGDYITLKVDKGVGIKQTQEYVKDMAKKIKKCQHKLEFRSETFIL